MPKEKEDLKQKKEQQEIQNRIQNKKNERELNRRKEDLDKRVAQIKEKARENLIKYGEEDDRTEFMTSLLGITLAMQECIERLTMASVAMQYVNDVVNVIDGVFKLNDDLLKTMTERKHGFFQRLIQRIKTRIAARNMRNKLYAAFSLVKDQMKLIDLMGSTLQNAMKGMNKSLNKRKKKKNTADKTDYYFRAKEMIKSEIQADTENQNGEGGTAPSTTSGGSAGVSTGGKSSEIGVSDL